MKNISAIAAVDANWGIGKNNALLVSIPSDMKNFRAVTGGNVIIMGRKTLESFPGGSPLPGRTNIVLTGVRNGIAATGTAPAAAEAAAAYPAEDVFVIGGASIYKQFLPYCTKAIITKIDHAYEADAYFPNLDKDPEWEIEEESDEQTYFDLAYTFTTYTRK